MVTRRIKAYSFEVQEKALRALPLQEIIKTPSAKLPWKLERDSNLSSGTGVASNRGRGKAEGLVIL